MMEAISHEHRSRMKTTGTGSPKEQKDMRISGSIQPSAALRGTKKEDIA